MFNQLLTQFTFHKWTLPRLSLPHFDRQNLASVRAAATLALILCAFIWGGGIVFTKQSLDLFPPVLLLVFKLSVSCATLWFIILVSGIYKTLKWSDWRYGLGGLFEPGLAYVLYMIGLSQTSAGNAALLSATEPLMVIAFAWMLLRERISRRVAMMLAIGLVGTALLALGSQESGAGLTGSPTGDLMILGSSVAAALSVVMTRRSIHHVAPLPLAAIQQTIGLIVVVAMLPWAIHNGELPQISAVPLTDWVVAAFSGVIQYAVVFILYMYAIKYVSTTYETTLLMLMPMFGLLGAVLFLGEHFSAVQLLGASLLLPSLFATRRIGLKV